MYQYTKQTIVLNFIYVGLLLFLISFTTMDWVFKAGLLFVAVLILKDGLKEMVTSFEVKKDRLVVKSKDRIVKEIFYKRIKYMTITRKNKKWTVLADDEGILFTIKPKIQNYQEMITDLVDNNLANKKMEIHHDIKNKYKTN
jgi:hypothetical protein